MVTFIPWNVATLAGVVVGGSIPDPTRLGLDVIFPCAMAGLAVALVTSRRELAAAGSGAAIGVAVALAVDPAAGLVAGGLGGPLLAMLLVPRPPAERVTPIIFGPAPPS
jgi:predicted branched-subunit amino acid permease